MLQVDRLTADEWQQWSAVRLTALADAPDAFGEVLADWIGADELQWRERLSTLPFLAIASFNGEPVGQVAALAPEPDMAIKLIAMWVAPEARGRGVGVALIDAVIAWARTEDAATVFLYVWPTNTAAIALYERVGFVRNVARVSPRAPEALAYELALA